MRRRPRRGVALMMVLWIVVILGSVSASVVRSARTSTGIAANVRASFMSRAAAESGVEATIASIEDTLELLGEGSARTLWLNSLAASGTSDSVSLGSQRFAVTVIDVSARLDINAATETQLRTFFSQFTDPGRAAGIAAAIRDRVDPASRVREPGGLRPASATPIRSLEELREHQLVPAEILVRAAEYLTVDGDGVVNALAASDTVLVAAAGEHRDEPGRLLVVSRGWVSGHVTTTEIQAVFAITGNRLVGLHRRERTL